MFEGPISKVKRLVGRGRRGSFPRRYKCPDEQLLALAERCQVGRAEGVSFARPLRRRGLDVRADAVGVLPFHDQPPWVHAELGDDVAQFLEVQFAELSAQAVEPGLGCGLERVELSRRPAASPLQSRRHFDELDELGVCSKPAECPLG
jgi:hypothetical protein